MTCPSRGTPRGPQVRLGVTRGPEGVRGGPEGPRGVPRGVPRGSRGGSGAASGAQSGGAWGAPGQGRGEWSPLPGQASGLDPEAQLGPGLGSDLKQGQQGPLWGPGLGPWLGARGRRRGRLSGAPCAECKGSVKAQPGGAVGPPCPLSPSYHSARNTPAAWLRSTSG